MCHADESQQGSEQLSMAAIKYRIMNINHTEIESEIKENGTGLGSQ